MSIILTGFVFGSYSLVAGIINFLLVFLMKSTFFDAVDLGKFKDAADKLLIWTILGLIFGVLGGIMLLICLSKDQGRLPAELPAISGRPISGRSGAGSAPTVSSPAAAGSPGSTGTAHAGRSATGASGPRGSQGGDGEVQEVRSPIPCLHADLSQLQRATLETFSNVLYF